ncbi:hypothetical protein Ct9H90mP29_16700 [bacterium]|nr:MAG: hypothetical protein Ct9H90mP29_16700 [bacterium]
MRSAPLRVFRFNENDLARSRLQGKKGFSVIQSDSLFKNWGGFAGTDEQRANELKSYFKKIVKAIFPGTGGYGPQGSFQCSIISYQ